MRRVLIVAMVVCGLVIAYFAYRRWYAAKNLNVEPHAREEIEKAKRR